MPDGPSPDPGFRGVWRIIAAQPAPWVNARALTKAQTPLLEYAVDFEEGAVKGPDPLACKSALYSSGTTYGDGLFGGKLAKVPRTDAMMAAVHLTRGSADNLSRDVRKGRARILQGRRRRHGDG